MLQKAIGRFKKQPRLIQLYGAIQHYPWGGTEYIPSLLNITNPTNEPYAELWIGAHPMGSSLAQLEGVKIGLDRLIENATKSVLGPRVIQKFGPHLPYLLKVLDAEKMLSIQVHPNKQQASLGYSMENQEGIPLDSPRRNYKDENHKPEFILALTDFYLLQGFRPLTEIKRTLEDIPEFHILEVSFGHNDLINLYRSVTKMPQYQIDNILGPLLDRLKERQKTDHLSKDSPDYWAVQADLLNRPAEGKHDRGIFSLYFLNLIHLKPGQGTFQKAGILHAYLQGTCIEIMANSDNVLRGGLTTKHINVDELLNIVSFETEQPKLVQGKSGKNNEVVFPTPADEFQLSKLALSKNTIHEIEPLNSPSAYLILEGSTEIKSNSDVLTCKKGDVFLLPAGSSCSIMSKSASVVFKALVP